MGSSEELIEDLFVGERDDAHARGVKFEAYVRAISNRARSLNEANKLQTHRPRCGDHRCGSHIKS